MPLYPSLLGSAYADLPPRLRELHGGAETRTWRGTAQVRRGRGLLARTIAAVLGLPAAGTRVPVSVTFSEESGGERWTRNFSGKIFSSLQTPGDGKERHLLVERFGAIAIAMALVVDGGRLYLIPRSWRLWRLPLPKRVLPSGVTYESQEQEKFCFNVEIAMPVIGLIVAYRGALEAAGV